MTVDSLPRSARGLLIALLVLAICSLPLPFWNCFLGFSNTDIYGFSSTRSSGFYSSRLNTIAGLGLAFGLVTLSYGILNLIKLTFFAMDLDGKINSKVRVKFVNICLALEVLFLVLTLIFGLALTLYARDSLYVDFTFWSLTWILMSVTFFLQLVTFPVMIKFRSVAKRHYLAATRM